LKFEILDFGFGILDFGFGILDFGFGIFRGWGFSWGFSVIFNER